MAFVDEKLCVPVGKKKPPIRRPAARLYCFKNKQRAIAKALAENDTSMLTFTSPLSHNAPNALRHTRLSLLGISHLLSLERPGR